ncbi:uncharacterized protein LODBEIA_P27370 [Lodderomyces beijingensis]|uniref:Uncharacterized protein n=1 Tax=Lodderomyces beijingensis TaxID=1775926 RepID=A0ABP0ZK29_9ASCO
MSIEKVEIFTQPEEHRPRSPSVEESAREKLEQLIEKHPIPPPEPNVADPQSVREATLNDIKQQMDRKNNGTSQPERDQDGFEIPRGKIPLDSQFSTEELKYILELCKEEGVLKGEVDLKVLEHGDLGDRVVIAESSSSDLV